MGSSKLLLLAFCTYAIVCRHVECMHQRKGIAEHLEGMPEAKRFRADVTELFLSNRVPGDRTLGLLQNAQLAGARNVSDLTKSYRATPPTITSHAARDLRRRLTKHAKWPKPYNVLIDCQDLKTGTTKPMWVPLWLPHEIVGCLEDASKGALNLVQVLTLFDF
jgi:hypothetical protein